MGQTQTFDFGSEMKDIANEGGLSFLKASVDVERR
jgi:hypothetical protein